MLGVGLHANTRRRFDKFRQETSGWKLGSKADLLGFEINTEEMSVQLPSEKIEQARVLVLSQELSPGNYGVAVKTSQQLRGLCAHWLNCNLFWRCLCQPIDLLLSHASESGTMICCGETEIWLAFFNALTLTRSLTESESDWSLLSKCGMWGASGNARETFRNRGKPRCSLDQWGCYLDKDGRGKLAGERVFSVGTI